MLQNAKRNAEEDESCEAIFTLVIATLKRMNLWLNSSLKHYLKENSRKPQNHFLISHFSLIKHARKHQIIKPSKVYNFPNKPIFCSEYPKTPQKAQSPSNLANNKKNP